MLIGQENQISLSLVETIGHFFPARFIVLNTQFEDQLQSVQEAPEFVFVNLMDVNQPEMVSQTVKQYFPETTLVGIHNFQSEGLINSTLAQGYDHYLNVFHLAEDLPGLLK